MTTLETNPAIELQAVVSNVGERSSTPIKVRPSTNAAKSFLAAKFDLGRMGVTFNALGSLSRHDIVIGITRHQCGDWGEVSEEVRRNNESSLKNGAALHSLYRSDNGTQFMVITERNGPFTTVLLPEDLKCH
jgi:hypothetical protein